jgi:hypothetical protein
MIIIELTGGLGNQMFQYALGHTLAAKGELVKFDISSYKRPSYAVDLNIPIGFDLKRAFAISEPTCVLERMPLDEIKELTIIEEKNYSFDQSLLLAKNALLKGRFQSFKYVNDSISLKKKITFSNDTSKRNYILKQDIHSSTSVAIHFRQGDYLSENYKNVFYNLPDTHYYERVLSLLLANVKNPKFYIFF